MTSDALHNVVGCPLKHRKPTCSASRCAVLSCTSRRATSACAFRSWACTVSPFRSSSRSAAALQRCRSALQPHGDHGQLGSRGKQSPQSLPALLPSRSAMWTAGLESLGSSGCALHLQVTLCDCWQLGPQPTGAFQCRQNVLHGQQLLMAAVQAGSLRPLMLMPASTSPGEAVDAFMQVPHHSLLPVQAGLQGPSPCLSSRQLLRPVCGPCLLQGRLRLLQLQACTAVCSDGCLKLVGPGLTATQPPLLSAA